MIKYLDIAIANESLTPVDIKGKSYMEVNQRIKAFRMVYPQGSIITDMISNIDGVCVFKASVISEDGVVLATGTAYEKENSSFINKTSYIENCETSAIGRALGIAGFGIDVSVASAEEVQNAINNQVVTKEDADAYKFTFGKYKDKTIKEVYKEDDKYLEWILGNSNDDRIKEMIALVLDLKLPTEEESKELLKLLSEVNDLIMETKVDREKLHNHFKVDNLNKLNKEQLIECKKILEKRLPKKED